MSNENDLYKEVKETEREVAKHPVPDEKIVLTGEEAKEAMKTEEEVGKKVDIQLEKDLEDRAHAKEEMTATQADSTFVSPVELLKSRSAENNTSTSTNEDTGILSSFK